MSTAEDFLQASIEILKRRIKKANPELSDEDVVYVAGAMMRSQIPWSDDILIKTMLETARSE